MFSRLMRKGLVGRITLTMSCVLMIPTFLVCVFYYKSYTNSLNENADTSLRQSNTRMENTMSTNLKLAGDVLDQLGYSQEFLYFLDGDNILSEREQRHFLKELQEEWINISYMYPSFFEEMNIYASNKQLQSNASLKFNMHSLEEFPHMDQTEGNGAIWFGDVQQLNGNASNRQFQVVNDNKYVVPVCLFIRSVNTEEIIGIVELDVLFEKIIDSRGLIDTREMEDYIFLNEAGEVAFQTGNFTAKEIKNLKDPDTPSEYRIIKSKSQKANINSFVLMKNETIIKAANNMIWRVGLIAILSAFIMVFLSYMVVKALLKRLVVMDEAMKQIELGHFDVFIEEDKQNDEISRLKERFNLMAHKLNETIHEVVEKENAQKNAELRALQAQINPHFLFNTLETMRMQCEVDRYFKISYALTALGDIFRYTIKWDGNTVPFQLEWANLENYISLMTLRLDDDFSYEMEMDERAENITVPKMFLQPIVENSFGHGFKQVPAPWHLKVEARVEHGRLRIIITDNGGGIEEGKLKELQDRIRHRKSFGLDTENNQSIGIINVLKRMDMICLEGSNIFIRNNKEQGVRIEILIVTEE